MNNHLVNVATKRKVMTRIYFEYAKNVFFGYPDYFMSAVFLVTSFIFISLKDVLINLPKDTFSNFFSFFVVAIRDTNWIIQLLIAGFFVRVVIVGSKLTYRGIKNINFGNIWLISRIKA